MPANPYERLLLRALPVGAHAQLLRACLRDKDAAAAAWTEFTRIVGDPKAFFENDQSGLKALLPLVESRLSANAINAGSAFFTYVRVAAVREGLRMEIYHAALAEMINALGAAGIQTVVLKGAALSATAYPQPSARHNHAIDLWVRDESLSAAFAALSRMGCTEVPISAGPAQHRLLRHRTSLAVALHSRPLFLPHFELPVEELRERTRVVSIGSAHTCVLSPEDALVHVCGHATYSRSRANLRWIYDAHYLATGDKPLDWHTVTRVAAAARLALPLFVQLRWLKTEMATPVPDQALVALQSSGHSMDERAKEGMIAAVFHSGTSWREAFRQAQTTRTTMLAFLRFSALPSTFYLRWKYGEPPLWKLPYYYMHRAGRFGRAQVRRLQMTDASRKTNMAERS